MKGLLFVSAFGCIAASAHATDVTYDLTSGHITSIYETGSLADGEFTATFPVPAAFTVNTSTLSGSVVNGVGNFTESFDFLKPTNLAQFDQGFQDIEAGRASFTVDYTGSKQNFTSFSAGVPTQYASGDIKGFVWGWDYLKTSAGSVLTITEQYLSYLGTDFGTATETIRNVNISVANPMQAPEVDPAGAASAITLLIGSLTVLRSRKRK